LALAVLIGVIISALVLLGRCICIRARKYMIKGVKHYYEIYGPLFLVLPLLPKKFDVLDDLRR
jgi:hypothetical protein